MSGAPPAGIGTISLIACAGYWANAALPPNAISRTPTIRVRIVFIDADLRFADLRSDLFAYHDKLQRSLCGDPSAHAARRRSRARRQARPCQPHLVSPRGGGWIRARERATRSFARTFPACAQHGAGPCAARRHPHLRPRGRGARCGRSARLSRTFHPRRDLSRAPRRARDRAQPFADSDSVRRNATAAAARFSHVRVPRRGHRAVRNTRRGRRYRHARERQPAWRGACESIRASGRPC